MEHFPIRTDLALESRERLEADKDEMRGVTFEEQYDEKRNVTITKVKIETENGARSIGKPIGTYLTLEAPDMVIPDEGSHREISEVLSEQLKALIRENVESVLVVGLGNREVTPDALGPEVIGNLYITRHILREYGQYAFPEKKMAAISGIVPGVMAQTGMETLEIIKGIINEKKPQLVIAIDALAARSVKRLGRTIQLADTGINPGSGVGNHRKGLNEETLGVPVIAIGVPTVVDAATIVYDVCQDVDKIPNGIVGMFVTPKNIDETVKTLSFTISEALNMTFELNF
ncbi:MAG: GPR endopeptidase [Lachnospiraceae bacterium]|nr:GPR endopeptidase [Lachnospiraceae bacterium]